MRNIFLCFCLIGNSAPKNIVITIELTTSLIGLISAYFVSVWHSCLEKSIARMLIKMISLFYINRVKIKVSKIFLSLFQHL